MRNSTKRFVVAVSALAIALASSSAMARAGGSAPPAKPAAKATAAAKPATAPKQASGRAGGATDSGMKRDSAVAAARQQQQQQAQQQMQQAQSRSSGSANAFGAGTGAGAGAATAAAATPPAAQTDRRFTTGQMLGAAAVGAVAGAVVHSAVSSKDPAPAYPTQHAPVAPGYAQPGYAQESYPQVAPVAQVAPAQVAPQYAQPQPQYAQPPQSSGIGGLGWLLILAALAGAGFFLYRKFSEAQATSARSVNYSGTQSGRTSSATPAFGNSPKSDPQQQLLADAPRIYRDVQDANNRADSVAMSVLVDDSFLPSMTSGFATRVTPSDTRVLSLDVVGNSVIDFETDGSRYVGSIHFDSLISEGGEPAERVQEVWHFVRPREGGQWKLAGIQVV